MRLVFMFVESVFPTHQCHQCLRHEWLSRHSHSWLTDNLWPTFRELAVVISLPPVCYLHDVRVNNLFHMKLHGTDIPYNVVGINSHC